MRLTNELRDYVHTKIAKIIPEPSSKEAAQDVNEAASKLRLDFQEFLSAQIDTYLSKTRGLEIFEGCTINVYGGVPNISVTTTGSPAVMQWLEDQAECSTFKLEIAQKVFALLSVQKEVEDLDKFIENVVASIR